MILSGYRAHTTGTTTATLTIEADPLDQQFSVVTLSISLYWIPIYGTIPTEYIGSQSANFYLDDEQDGPTGWYYFANFFATYQDIGPDGTIVNGDGSAVVDMTYNIPTDGTGEFLYVHFQSDSAVPEPSSLALMISAILVVVSAAWSAFRSKHLVACGRARSVDRVVAVGLEDHARAGGAFIECVGSGAADKLVGAGPRVERIGARAAKELIHAAASLEEVCPATAPGDRV